jgi:predicted nucleotidyltransferase
MNNTHFTTALFSQTQQILLGLFYLHPERSFYTNEIIRLSHKGTGAVHRELFKLAESGIIRVEALGNQKRYSANLQLPFYQELRGIILKTFGLADIIRNSLEPIESKIQYSFIYGSIAKNSDTITSDIDLMIISDELGYSDIFPYIEKAEKQLQRPINPTCYSINEWSRKIKSENNFLIQVKISPKIFIIGTEDEFTKLG